MKINGEDIESIGAVMKQWRFDPEMRSIKNESEWVRGSPLPIFQKNSADFKPFTVTLMIHGENREDIETIVSKIMSKVMGPVEIELDGRLHKFTGILDKADRKEHDDSSRWKWQSLELSFSGYEHGDWITKDYKVGEEIILRNFGTAISPAIIEITPTADASEIVISGICRDPETLEDEPVTIRNLTEGSTVVLDGYNGLITENGSLKAEDVDLWELPTMAHGTNEITVKGGTVKTTIKVLPIFL